MLHAAAVHTEQGAAHQQAVRAVFLRRRHAPQLFARIRVTYKRNANCQPSLAQKFQFCTADQPPQHFNVGILKFIAFLYCLMPVYTL